MHWNVTEHPTASWVWRQLIEATPWNTAPRFLIRDRDRSFGGNFVIRARGIGIETVLTPIRSPNANAICERVIGTLRRDCLDHVIVLGERSAAGAARVRQLLRRDATASLVRAGATGGRSRTPLASERSRGLHHRYRWAA